jgi:hypothetical protein
VFRVARLTPVISQSAYPAWPFVRACSISSTDTRAADDGRWVMIPEMLQGFCKSHSPWRTGRSSAPARRSAGSRRVRPRPYRAAAQCRERPLLLWPAIVCASAPAFRAQLIFARQLPGTGAGIQGAQLVIFKSRLQTALDKSIPHSIQCICSLTRCLTWFTPLNLRSPLLCCDRSVVTERARAETRPRSILYRHSSYSIQRGT